MKKFSKILSVALLVALVLSLGVANAFADSTATHTITVNSIEGDTETHTYDVYQVFAGDYSKEGEIEKLSNITWGSGVNGDAILAAVIADTTNFATTAEATKTANDVAKLLNANNVEAFSKIVAANKKTDKKAATGESPLTVRGDGYYFVEDVSTGLDEATKTNYIMDVVGNVTATAKADIPTVEKKVKDINDSTGLQSDWQDSADYDIGDTIPFQITGTLPQNYSTYDTYQYIFTDTMSKGLTYTAKTAKIYAVKDSTKTDITNMFVEKVEAGANETTVITWTCNNLKAGTSFAYGYSIVVEYNATLNNNAILGVAGNPNKVTLKYSNNPNNGGDGTSETPEDKNIVFTFQVHVDKFKEEVKTGNELTGAGFTLYKEVPTVAEGETQLGTRGSAITFAESVEHSAINNDKYYIVIENVDVDSNGATFDFKGIDDGNYVLVETTIPAGYNAWKSVAVTVSADHDEEANEPTLTELKGGDPITGDVVIPGNVNTGVLDTDIVNNSGATLPSTGGIGTLVLAAIILLVTKKRMSE